MKNKLDEEKILNFTYFKFVFIFQVQGEPPQGAEASYQEVVLLPLTRVWTCLNHVF